MEKVSNFATLWKATQLQERIDKPQSQNKADDIRNILVYTSGTRASGCLDNVSFTDLFLREAERYAELVDSPEQQGGLNNYAESIMPLLQGKRNESNKWQSSFKNDHLADLECIKRYKESCKASMGTLIPPGREQDPVPYTKHTLAFTDRKSQHQTTKNHPTSSNMDPYKGYSFKQGNRTSDSGKTTDKHISSGFVNNPGISNNHSVLPANNSSTSITARTSCNNNESISKDSNVCGTFKSNVTPSSGCFWNVGESANLKNPTNDQGKLFSEQRHRGQYDEGRDLPMYRKNEVSNKRSRDTDDEDYKNAPAGATPMFRTARQQLAIDNQKKYSNKNKAQGNFNTSTYGTNKKSLGTRRGLNSKFVPPVLNKEDDDGGTLVQRAGPRHGGNAVTDTGEEIDERLKNIEPKMVELIMSEIMDQGQPLTWDDIAGLQFAKKTIQEIVVWPMLRPDIFTGLRGPPKGLLLFGPPGTGKTLIGKCIASQSKSTFFSISASSLTSKWVGEGEKMVRALFAVARVHQPAVVFIDEIDSLLSQRSETEHESSRRIKTEFLVQLDGTTTGETDRILVVGATNRPQEIDEAARRRFVKRLYIPLPEAVARKQIIHNLMSQQSHHLEDNELDSLLVKSEGYSGADMANLCREAALGPIRSIPLCDIENITADQVRPIVYKDFEEALKQVRASVSEKDLDLYLDWNKQYGSWGM